MKALLTFLSDAEIEKIHEASLNVLENTGVSIHSSMVTEHLRKKGAKVVGDNVRFPKKMVEEAIGMVNQTILFAGREEKFDFAIPGKRTYNSTGGYAPFIYDVPGQPRRRSTAEDLVAISKLAQSLEELDLFWPIVLPTEEPNAPLEEICAYYTAVQHVTKHIECTVASPEAASYMVRMAQAAAGGEEALKKRPILSCVASPTTPLAFEKWTSEAYPILAKAGVPVTPMNVPLAGTTAPVTFAGALVITNAEQLATLTILKSYQENAPMLYSCDTGTSDMKTGDITYNAPDYDLLSIGCAQLARFYKLPSCVSHGSNEKKDFYTAEAFMNNIQRIAFSQMTGTDTSIWMGSADNSIASSSWDIMLDAEALRYAKSFVREFAVDNESLAIDVIHEVGPRGEFMSHEHTVEHFRSELNMLDPADSYILKGGPEKDYIQQAYETARKRIADAPERIIDDVLLKELKQLMGDARKELSNLAC